MRRALVTGITGQDGSYLAEWLVGLGYEVWGLVRSPAREHPHLAAVADRLSFVRGDLLDPGSLRAAVAEVAPDELYHLAAPTYVPASWEDPAGTLGAVAGATTTLLGAVAELAPAARVFVATSSEIFGDAGESPQHEGSPMRPRTPYGVAKLAAHGMVGVLRERHGLHASAGIAYNHESPRRPAVFLPRKVTRGAAAISLGLQHELVLGDLDAVRDWSDARDVMRGAWLILQHDEPADHVLASGVARTVRELADVAFGSVGLRAEDHVRSDPGLVRPSEDTVPVGDPRRARERLGWTAEIGFGAMIGEMVQADIADLKG